MVDYIIFVFISFKNDILTVDLDMNEVTLKLRIISQKDGICFFWTIISNMMLHSSFIVDDECALWLWERWFKGQDHHRQFKNVP